MSYVGNTPTQQAFTPAVDFFNGNGSTTAFTLSRPVASVAQVQAVISNVPQKPGDAFTVSGNTITFTSAPPSGTQNIYVYYTSPITQVIAPGQGTVDTAALVDGSVTSAKLNSKTGTGAVALASLPSFTTTIGVGGATASASGSGVSFPATQSASSDANTLDDYEEGTWTPAIESDTPGTGRVNLVSYARYTKIGNQVTVEFSVQITTLGSGGSGVWVINGLPFSSANAGTLNVGSANSLASSLTGLGGITNATRFVMRTQNGASSTYLSNATFSSWVTTGTYVQGSCTYLV